MMTVMLLCGLIAVQQHCLAYKSVAFYSGAFAAVGNGASIDFFSREGGLLKQVELPEGTVLNCVHSFCDVLVAAGKNYLAVYDGVNLYGNHVRGDVAAMAEFRGNLLVAVNTPEGAQLLSFDSPWEVPEIIALNLKGCFTDISASEIACCGVTDTGEIFCTFDGSLWTVMDFNVMYAGYYPPVEFISAVAGGNSIAVAGRTASGTNAMFISSEGKVWSERELSSLEDGAPSMLEEQVLGLAYDRLADRYICLCTGGTLFFVPSCTHCNSVRRINTNELHDLEFIAADNLFLVGSDRFSAVIPR